MLLFLFLLLLIPNAILEAYERSDAYLATATAGWFFFTLINAYYSGALTMFFANEMTLPFTQMSDVIEAYPTYILMILAGNEALYTNEAELYKRIVTKSSEAWDN